MNQKYIFTSQRLGFRNWTETDLPEFAQLNADKNVMQHFPATLTEKETSDFIKRLQQHYEKHGHTYFAVELLETGEFIGFIGLVYQEYTSAYTPATDIGWRLKKTAWGKGFATEGAKRCLEFAFNHLQLDKVIATCTKNNTPSENVMIKAGMKKIGEFNHPKLIDYPHLEKCVCYEMFIKTYSNNL